VTSDLEAEVRRLRREHDPRCLSLTESENNVYCDCRTLAMIDGAAAVTERLIAERDRLRAAVDAALALHASLRDGPFSLIDYEYCSCRADEVHVDGDGSRSIGPAKYPCPTRRTLAPVADPDPHTTSEKEQQ
jgi:hypothetical protein